MESANGKPVSSWGGFATRCSEGHSELPVPEVACQTLLCFFFI